jgi:F420-non-reducing hydrogenase iron-sulfur subunit
MLSSMGIEKERLRLEWISASEGDKVQRVTNEMVEQIRKLGPLQLAPLPTPSMAEDAAATGITGAAS